MENYDIPITFIYGAIATCGGIARYLVSYTNGRPFKLTMFAASGFVSGFSGWMFALIGQSLSMPQPLLFVMAGIGGFMGEQTMKLIWEFVEKRIK